MTENVIAIIGLIFSILFLHQLWISESGIYLDEHELEDNHYVAGYIVYTIGMIAIISAFLISLFFLFI